MPPVSQVNAANPARIQPEPAGAVSSAPSVAASCPECEKYNCTLVTLEEGKKIAEEAKSWAGTAYKALGQGSKKNDKGDCSGSTYHIYLSVNLPYTYTMSNGFPAYAEKSKLFVKVKSPQPGDIGHWPGRKRADGSVGSGHLAIYADNFEGYRTKSYRSRVTKKMVETNIWTTHDSGGGTYGPGESGNVRGEGNDPTWYRYCKPNTK